MYSIKWAIHMGDHSESFVRYYDTEAAAVMAQGELIRQTNWLGISGYIQIGEIRYDEDAEPIKWNIGQLYRIP